MIVHTQPAILPADYDLRSETLPITQPVDPHRISNGSAMLAGAIDAIEIKANDAVYHISFVNNWAADLKAPHAAKPTPVYVREHAIPVELLVQIGNTCGPTSLTMAMRGLGVRAGLDEVIEKTRCSPFIGTSPLDIRSCAQSFGFNASVVNNASIGTVIDALDKGGACIAILEQSRGLHYVVINGYRIDEKNQKEFLITDPNGHQYYLTEVSFRGSWSDTKLMDHDTGLNRCMIHISKGEVIPNSFNGLSYVGALGHSIVNAATHNVGFFIALALGALFPKFKRKPRLQAQKVGDSPRQSSSGAAQI